MLFIVHKADRSCTLTSQTYSLAQVDLITAPPPEMLACPKLSTSHTVHTRWITQSGWHQLSGWRLGGAVNDGIASLVADLGRTAGAENVRDLLCKPAWLPNRISQLLGVEPLR